MGGGASKKDKNSPGAQTPRERSNSEAADSVGPMPGEEGSKRSGSFTRATRHASQRIAEQVTDSALALQRKMVTMQVDDDLLSEGHFGRRYRMTDVVLGAGSFATVRVCEMKETGERCAVKVISKYRDGKGVKSTYLNDEIRILRRCGRHDHIVNIYDVYETYSSVLIVLELATGGSLLDRIIDIGKFSERDAADVVKQISTAIKFLHSQGVVHRDLKPENLLLKDNDTFIVKVTDFGLSKIFSNDGGKNFRRLQPDDMMAAADEGGAGGAFSKGNVSSNKDHDLLMRTVCGSRSYAAPEVLSRVEYDQSVDVWGIGVIMAILCTGEHPMAALPSETTSLLRALRRDEGLNFETPAWEQVSEYAKALIAKTMRASPVERLTPGEILEDPWICKNVAPTTPLPNVLSGLQKIKLDGLQKLVLQVMATKIENKDMIAEANRLFAELDVGKHGVIKKSDLSGLLKTKSGTAGYRAHLDAIFDSLDIEGSGEVTVTDFQAALLTQHKSLMKSLLAPVFRHMDTSGTGKVSTEDMVRVFKEMGQDGIDEDEIRELMSSNVRRAKSRQGSVTINLPEFMDMMGGLVADKNRRLSVAVGAGGPKNEFEAIPPEPPLEGLADGWTIEFSASKNRWYYFEASTGTSQWERPTESHGPAQDAVAPTTMPGLDAPEPAAPEPAKPVPAAKPAPAPATKGGRPPRRSSIVAASIEPRGANAAS